MKKRRMRANGWINGLNSVVSNVKKSKRREREDIWNVSNRVSGKKKFLQRREREKRGRKLDQHVSPQIDHFQASKRGEIERERV